MQLFRLFSFPLREIAAQARIPISTGISEVVSGLFHAGNAVGMCVKVGFMNRLAIRTPGSVAKINGINL